MTEKVFLAGLHHLREMNPNHPFLPRILAGGYSVVTIAYLSSALKTVIVPEAPKVEIKVKSSPELNQMYSEQAKLFKQRAARSNAFHDCLDDAARAVISDQVDEIQQLISKTMRKISFYKQNGTVAIDHEKEKFYVPKDPIELFKKHTHLKQSISRAKKNLEDRKNNGKSIDRAEQSLKNLLEYEAIIQREISSQGLQS